MKFDLRDGGDDIARAELFHPAAKLVFPTPPLPVNMRILIPNYCNGRIYEAAAGAIGHV